MRVVVTGGKGQLGSCLKDEIFGKTDIDALFLDESQLDITDAKAVDNFFADQQYDIIINCAAYTAVDKAEEEKESAYRVNVTGTENLAKVAQRGGSKIVHISTDYVFDGEKETAYTESDKPNPKTHYGLTKYEGEKALKTLCPQAIIIRTAWLYSHYGKNFFLTMKQRAKEGLESHVVDDQTGAPTLANDLAKVILQIISSKPWIPGVYHFSNGGATTWYEFAKEIYRLQGMSQDLVKPISTESYGAMAPRPKYSVLDTQKISKTYNIEIQSWQQALATLNKK